MTMRSPSPEFNAEATRCLVANDPFLAYTVVRHTGEAEDHWLHQVFNLEVCSDPGLCSRYRSLLRHSRVNAQPVH